MSSENNFYRDNENLGKNFNSSNNKYNIYKTKEDILPYNSKYKPNSEEYIKLDPEYLENNYKKEENYQNNNNKSYRSNPNTKNNNYYANKNNFKKSPLNSRKLKETESPFGTNDNNQYYGNNTLDSNRDIIYPDNFNVNKSISPFKNNNNNKRRSFNYNKNDNNNYDDSIYLNRSIEYDNRKNNINNSYSTMTEPKNYNPKLMIYQKKMITIFVQIINKIIEKNKKKYIMSIFFNELKNIIQKSKYDEYYLYRRRNTKYNPYKNIMFVSAREKNRSPKGVKYYISNNDNKLIKNMRKEKKYEINQRYNNTLKQKIKGKNKTNMERLIELQKKYDKIYEKKKNDKTISIDDKYKRYILRKNKTQDVFNITFDKPLTDEKYFKTKVLKNRLNMGRKKPSPINLSHDFIPSLNKGQFIYFPKNLEKKVENYKTKKFNTPKNPKNKIVLIKKVKMTPRVPIIKKTEIFKVYNIKDIVTPDKRLYVYINYITLSNKKNNKITKYKYYDNNLLKISDRISINYIDINKKYKPKLKIIKYQIHLTKIKEEEPLYSITEEDKNENKNLGQYDYLEKAITILERYKNKLKKNTIKNSILNFGNDKYEEEE